MSIKTNSFTLIEMLVVIAIIAILASMMAPALTSAVDSARQISCLNNLRQVGNSFRHYADDWNDYIYPCQQNGWKRPYWYMYKDATYGLKSALYPYFGTERILDCPANSNKTYGEEHLQGGHLNFAENNILVLVLNGWSNRWSAVAAKKAVILVGDTSIDNPRSDFSLSSMERIGDHHNGGANFYFLDGHAENIMKILLEISDFKP